MTAPAGSGPTVIGVATVGYEAGLQRCLTSLLELDEADEVTVEIAVVDNSLEGLSPEFRCWVSSITPGVHLVREPRRGIPHARNRLLKVARELGAARLLMIDDDETVTASWLCAMLAMSRGYPGAIIGGPVLPRFEDAPPRWAVRGGFFERASASEGADVARFLLRDELDALVSGAFGDYGPVVATNNLLLPAEALRGPYRFDERFPFEGGTDRLFLKELVGSGTPVRWAPSAIVHEHLNRDRVSISWLLRRSFRIGNNSVRLTRHRGRVLLAAMMALLGAGTHLLQVPRRGTTALIAAARSASRASGAIVGVAGLRYREYGGKPPRWWRPKVQRTEINREL